MKVQEFKRAFKDLRATSGFNEEVQVAAKSLLDVHDGFCFVWNAANCSILAVQLKNNVKVKIVPTDTPLFQLSTLKVSPNGRHICLSGPKGIYVVELPPKSSSKPNRFSIGEEDEVICRVLPVGGKFYSTNSKNCIQQLIWHPGSKDESFLTVLSSDNVLRIFNVDKGQFPDQSIQLNDSQKCFGDSVLSMRAALGDTAVGVCFGEEIAGVWPVYVLYGDGKIYTFLNGLGEEAIFQPRIVGPLRMEPESESNYEQDFCAILHLYPAESSPPVLVLASNHGSIFHCIVLHDQTDENLLHAGRNCPPEMTLYVYESVELDFGFFSQEGDDLKPFNYPITLTPDSGNPNRYFCSHYAGIHCVGLPMVSKLAELALIDEKIISSSSEIPMAEEDSIVEQLICTDLRGKTKGEPTNGISIVTQGLSSYLICALSDFQIEVLALSSAPYFPVPIISLVSEETPGSKFASSRREGFDQHIAKILQKPTTQPLIKNNSGSPSGEELLNIITKSTKVLREEYLARLDKARLEIERKVQLLESQKAQQQGSLLKLRQEKKNLRDRACQLSETYQDLQDNNERLTARMENVLSKIQNQLSIRSDSELKMDRRLLEISRKMKDLKNGLEQIQTKEKYQLRQIRESKDVVQRGSPLTLSQKQLQSIKDVLESNSNDIADLMKQLKSAEKNIATC